MGSIKIAYNKAPPAIPADVKCTKNAENMLHLHIIIQ